MIISRRVGDVTNVDVGLKQRIGFLNGGRNTNLQEKYIYNLTEWAYTYTALIEQIDQLQNITQNN